MTRDQLKQAVNLAYDVYWHGLEDLAKDNGWAESEWSPRRVEDDPITKDAAAALWDAYVAKEDSLNNEFFESSGGPTKGQVTAQEHALCIHNAKAALDAARFNLEQEQDAINHARKFGVSPDAATLSQLGTYIDAVKDAEDYLQNAQ